MNVNSRAKPSGAATVLFNESKHILLVKPVYKPGWALPGGTIEAGESPREASMREVYEELGIRVLATFPLCLDYQSGPEGESYQFLFYAPPLSANQIATISVQTAELSEFGFYDLAAARRMLTPKQGRRLAVCLSHIRDHTVLYLENTAPTLSSTGSDRDVIGPTTKF